MAMLWVVVEERVEHCHYTQRVLKLIFGTLLKNSESLFMVGYSHNVNKYKN